MNTSARLSTASSRVFDAPPVPATPADSAAWSGAYWLLRRRAWLIIGFTLLICLIALPTILGVPKRYYAQTRVLVAPASALSLTSDMGGRKIGPEVDTDAEIERLVSRDVTEAVIARFALDRRAEFNSALEPPSPLAPWIDKARAALDRILVNAGLGTGAPTDSRDSPEPDQADQRVAQAFEAALGVSRQGTLGVITVGFTSRDPDLAAAVPGALVDTYLAERETNWRREVTDAANWLETRIRADQDRVATMRADLDHAMGETGIEQGATEESVAHQLQTVMDRQADLARERLDISATRRSVLAARADPDLTARSEPERLGDLRHELATELRKLRDIATTYGEANDVVKHSKDLIAAIRADIDAGLAAFDRSLELTENALSSESDQLDAKADNARRQLTAIRNLAPRIDKQIEELRASEKALSELEYRQQVLLAQAQLAPVSIERLSEARVPHDPVGPGRKVYLLITGVGALLLSLTLATLLELRDATIRSHEQLAHLPLLVPVGLWPRLSRGRRRAMARDISGRAATPTAELLRDMLLMLQSADGGHLPDVLTVASPRAEDMVLPVAEWIAAEIAASGRPVRLIRVGSARPIRRRRGAKDDTRDRPYLEHSIPELAAQCGSELSGGLTALSDATHDTRMITIVEAPPLLSPGALRYARFGGEILLVLRWGGTPRSVVELTAGLLAKLATPPVFSLILDARPRRHRLYGFGDRLSVSHPLRRHRAAPTDGGPR
ncbi:exopolysaccharide transport protein family protein (plasmid) [Paracoccaceae bacterium]|nr:exopolysaccharide transport protein family protein [Paracoccaceae bacterium]